MMYEFIPTGASVRPVRPTGVLSRFKFYKVLGKGGFGKVLLARELDTKQLIAVKVAAKSKVLEFVSSVMIEMEILKAAQDCEFLTPEYVTFQSKVRELLILINSLPFTE
ncbi:protein kinase C eta type-like [Xenopus laevis]|uniref:non-specific serine/threonine protein kinase n=1 Tax=Xenopus laevis TaxID=8355 RepID=A0A8J1N170_XENLA|nr:protein kinase C eta type-like [Xenopus laevis]